MRCMEINKQTVYYCLYQGEEDIIDSAGNRTGEKKVSYSAPVKMRVNVSPARGTSQVETFGNDINYDRVIVTDDTSCPIDEHTVMFIEKQPAFNAAGLPLYDYVVRRVAKSLNSVSIAVGKVKTS